MSNAQKLKEANIEYRKANKDLDDKLNKAEENNRLNRQALAEKSSRQN